MSLAALIAATAASTAPVASETPNLFGERADCASIRRQVLDRLGPARAPAPTAARRGLRKLGELAQAKAEYAVARQVEGCMVPAPVGYPQTYLLPGAADAKPAGAPPNRR